MPVEIVTPGQRLGHAQDYAAGPGTYVRGDFLYASVVGVKRVLVETDKKTRYLTVSKEKVQSAVPTVGNIVRGFDLKCMFIDPQHINVINIPGLLFYQITGKVIRINQREAVVSIMVIGNAPCGEDFQGIIRKQDVRQFDRDKVKISDSFRPGDIVRAKVISLGDARSYYLSTADNDFGGCAMYPISWEEMQCPKMKEIERRKCAKP
ncbi:3435_t:CDS:2 [Paraglomus occultum]|uniref:3435_t:CDS:1 n=1 Tax=Paraglomus occultum TaxID=144539 RepID=A0A9N8ZXA5_9GLOM|nr:3435_t:CDS:2 [Paraglomus occultum]